MKDGKAETFEEWIAIGQEMFKDDPDIEIMALTDKDIGKTWCCIHKFSAEDWKLGEETDEDNL